MTKKNLEIRYRDHWSLYLNSYGCISALRILTRYAPLSDLTWVTR